MNKKQGFPRPLHTGSISNYAKKTTGCNRRIQITCGENVGIVSNSFVQQILIWKFLENNYVKYKVLNISERRKGRKGRKAGGREGRKEREKKGGR